jgi:altronate dehydratase small subunit
MDGQGNRAPTGGSDEAPRQVYVLHPDDNIAVALVDLMPGQVVTVSDGVGVGLVLTVTGNIVFGHKIATRPIAVGDTVRKYGEDIGLATVKINPGDHVHTHNIESQRGRGDLHRPSAN